MAGLDSAWKPKASFNAYESSSNFNLRLISHRARSWLNGALWRRIVVLVLLLYAILSLFSPLQVVPRFSKAKVVIILASNQGGGVFNPKGAGEWAIERDSIANKRAYAKKWGYELAVKDLSQKKRYAHEWRESWEKADIIRETMRQYPKAEWFWWLDLHTYIMEPTKSIEQHILNKGINQHLYRNISTFNPLGLPVNIPNVDNSHPVDLILSQDCGGFNLGSFFIRRSAWSERLLDVWWDPVFYEQKHMEWDHKEQDALEYMYTNQAWLRSGVGFIPQRMLNSFPPGACSEQADDPRYFYSEQDRDFVVNMAGCEWGRDCASEMMHYRRISEKLNSGRWRN